MSTQTIVPLSSSIEPCIEAGAQIHDQAFRFGVHESPDFAIQDPRSGLDPGARKLMALELLPIIGIRVVEAFRRFVPEYGGRVSARRHPVVQRDQQRLRDAHEIVHIQLRH